MGPAGHSGVPGGKGCGHSQKTGAGREGKKLADGLLVQWRDALTHFLEWIEETLGREGEMESVLSGLCRNPDTGYLLAVGGNPLYMRLCREMNLQTRGKRDQSAQADTGTGGEREKWK